MSFAVLVLVAVFVTVARAGTVEVVAFVANYDAGFATERAMYEVAVTDGSGATVMDEWVRAGERLVRALPDGDYTVQVGQYSILTPSDQQVSSGVVADPVGPVTCSSTQRVEIDVGCDWDADNSQSLAWANIFPTDYFNGLTSAETGTGDAGGDVDPTQVLLLVPAFVGLGVTAGGFFFGAVRLLKLFDAGSSLRD
ncbi:MAG TPA: hypothetical protein VG710_17905 [Opitutus sp.]|nr:hypothetical protein [Opitutus sp.]